MKLNDELFKDAARPASIAPADDRPIIPALPSRLRFRVLDGVASLEALATQSPDMPDAVEERSLGIITEPLN